MTSGIEPEPLFNPFAPGFTDNPYPQYAMLREQAPVYPHPFGFWLVTRHADVSALLRARSSVELRNVAGLPTELFADSAGQIPQLNQLSMLDRDPPDHTRLRKLVAKAFTPRAIEALRPRVEELVDGLLAEMDRAGTVDLVDALAFPLPFMVIAEMLGTPPADHVRLRELTGTLVRSLEPVAEPELMHAIVEADAELMALGAHIVEWKRRNPADDLLTALIHAEDDGDMLDEDELVAQMLLLYIAGHETTVNLLGGGTLALLGNPDQFTKLTDDPSLVDNAVEELLRYDSPVQISRRITLEPTTIGGTTIPANTFVMAGLGAANRDREYWGADADELRVGRPNARQHLSFGAGPHHCLGAALARLEATVAFGKLATRFPGLAMAGDVVWNGRINLRGPAKLPVTVT